MRTTDNPILYAYAHPEVKQLLRHLKEHGPDGHEATRKALGVDPQMFSRMTRLLAGYALIRIQAADGAEWIDRSIRLKITLSRSGARFLEGLDAIDATLEARSDLFGPSLVESLLRGETVAQRARATVR